MSGFDICFLPETTDGSEIGNTGLHGMIRIGEETEYFVSLIGFWSPSDYRWQWLSAVDRIVSGAGASCLITSIYDPADSEFVNWWLLYREREKVYLQESILLLKRLAHRFSTTQPYVSIPPRRTVTAGNREVSEWELPLSDFEAFLHRQH